MDRSIGETVSIHIDERILFHVGAPVSSGDADAQIKIFERIWLLWAGPPQTIYLDPLTENASQAWQNKMQWLDVHTNLPSPMLIGSWEERRCIGQLSNEC